MTHDTDYPKERVDEREHGVFVPPNEQHVREDGAPTDPAEPAEHESRSELTYDERADRADSVDSIGTEAVPPRADRDTEPTLVDPEPATPLDTGTAEDAERSEDMAAGGRVDDIGAEDETRQVSEADPMDARDVDEINLDGRSVDERDVDAGYVDAGDVDQRDQDARQVDADNVDSDNVDSDNVDSDKMDAVDVNVGDIDSRDVDEVHADGIYGDGRDVDAGDVAAADVDAADVDTDAVAVGTAAVPEQATAPAAEFWPSGMVDDLRSRWDSVQMRFVDDPSGVAADARALVGEAVTAIREAIDRLESRLDEAVDEAAGDTEQLRQRVAHYRNVFESLLQR